MKAVVWDIKTKLDEIFAFLSKGRKRTWIYQFYSCHNSRNVFILKTNSKLICKTVIVFYSNIIQEVTIKA